MPGHCATLLCVLKSKNLHDFLVKVTENESFYKIICILADVKYPFANVVLEIVYQFIYNKYNASSVNSSDILHHCQMCIYFFVCAYQVGLGF